MSRGLFIREDELGMEEGTGYDLHGTVRNSRFLHCASLSLRESEASVGMTGFTGAAICSFPS
jgi:hypothetical protein